MKSFWYRFLQWSIRFLGFISGLIGLYILSFLVLGLIPVNRSFAQTQTGIEIMVIDNGVHTDLVLPIKTKTIDWHKYLLLKDYAGADSSFSHVAFGWGNRRFYMETPQWKDMRIDVALSAALGFGRSAMHVYYIPKPLKSDKTQISIKLSEAQYERLVAYILNSFQQQNGGFLLIKDRGYTSIDNFYEANGRFSMFKTCNSWTNAGLKAAGVETVYWAPVPYLMMRQLREQYH